MRSLRARAILGALTCLLLAACGLNAAPPPDPVQIGLQNGDLPAGLHRCAASGSVDGYIRDLRSSPPAHDELATAWQGLRRQGAVAAAVAVYAEQTPDCTARLGAGAGASVASVVVSFQDDERAVAAYQQGIFGFTTPSEDADVPDMTRGAATGIGRNAWILERSVQGRALIVGLWERHAVLVLFVAVDADPLNTKHALAVVDSRIS